MIRGIKFGLIVKVLMGLILVASLLGLTYLRTWPPIVLVMSDSMEPKIKVGDVVLMKAVTDPIEVGDIIEIKVPEKLQEREELHYPEAVVHRVISIKDGLARTQGDNLEKPDPWKVPVAGVDKEVFKVVPGAGRILSFIMSPFGLLWLALGVILFFVLPLFDFQRERVELERVELNALDQLRAEINSIDVGGVTGVSPEQREEIDEIKTTLGDLVGAVGDYGHHLRSHTEILQGMSRASQDLASTVASLQSVIGPLKRDVLVPSETDDQVEEEMTPETSELADSAEETITATEDVAEEAAPAEPAENVISLEETVEPAPVPVRAEPIATDWVPDRAILDELVVDYLTRAAIGQRSLIEVDSLAEEFEVPDRTLIASLIRLSVKGRIELQKDGDGYVYSLPG